MIKIAPSILSADFANLERDIQRISTADYVHVDVMDGMFVPNITIGIPVVKSIRPTTALPLDVHLMIVEPGRYVEQFCDAGADLVTVHVESDTEEKLHDAIARIHAKGKRAGVVLKPKTPAETVLPFLNEVELVVLPFLNEVELVLVMTVEPGFGGQKFMADMMPKVSAIRRWIDEKNPGCELEVDGGVDPVTCKTWPKVSAIRRWIDEKNPGCELEVDGGVDPVTCKTCIAAGANVLVAGSAVYKADDIPARIAELRG